MNSSKLTSPECEGSARFNACRSPATPDGRCAASAAVSAGTSAAGVAFLAAASARAARASASWWAVNAAPTSLLLVSRDSNLCTRCPPAAAACDTQGLYRRDEEIR